VNRILVPLDGSDLSRTILPIAEVLARDHEAELVLLGVVGVEGAVEVEARAREEAEAHLADAASGVRARGLDRVRTAIWFGEPDQAIANAAFQEKADLVAMSTHGRSGLDRLRFGSVAEGVVRKAPAPVLLVRGAAAWGAKGIGRIVVPLDGSPLAEAVLPVVAALAGPFDFSIDLVRAVEPVTPSPLGEPVFYVEEQVLRTDADAYLARLAETLEAKGLRVARRVRIGPAVDVIRETVRETGAGLIAMSTHGRTGWNRLVLGSVAERVLRVVDVPVLLWRAPIDGSLARPSHH
jgi:nucleotide-binding universal stress UspA family protein